MNATDLSTYVGASPEDVDFVTSCWDEAQVMVDSFIGSADVPAQVRNRAVLEVGSELFHRRSAPQGNAQFATFDGAPIRINRDPMVAAYALLSKWVLPL